MRKTDPFNLVLLLWSALARPLWAGEPQVRQSMASLEARQKAVASELETLARFSLRSGSGAVGHRSAAFPSAHQLEWVEIQLDGTKKIDEIVLVPVLRRDSQAGYQAEGFPEALRIWAGTDSDRTGHCILTLTPADHLLPRIAPLIIPLSTTASWIQIEATQMTPNHLNNTYLFQLSEVLIFQGEENLALHRPVSASSTTPDHSAAWDPSFLTDGHMPYLMDAAHGRRSSPYIGLGTAPPSLTIDLQQRQPLTRIHLHAVDQSDTVPQAYLGDFGMPRHLIVEGADQPDFSTAQLLLDAHRESITETGPIMMWNIPQTTCRYVRLTTVEPDPQSRLSSTLQQRLMRAAAPGSVAFKKQADYFWIGYAEIELYAGSTNVALHKPVTASHILFSPTSQPKALTDGHNLYGVTLPLRTWLHQLAARHQLETEQTHLNTRLSLLYSHQKQHLTVMTWLASLLTAGIALVMLLARAIHLRHLKKTKQRVAADLHDELGANLHAIALFGDLAKQEVENEATNPRWQRLINHLNEVRALTERAGDATRSCTQMLDSNHFDSTLSTEMQRTAQRLLADLDYTGHYPDDAQLAHLKPRQRMDLFLFHKECLINLIRHSGATQAKIELSLQSRTLSLIITDNGQGLNGTLPPSVKRRAQLMRGTLHVEHPPQGGSSIHLTLRTPKKGAPPHESPHPRHPDRR